MKNIKTEILSFMKEESKYWWTSLLVGLVAIILGIWCLCTPASAFLALSIVFIISFLFAGILDIAFAIANREILSGWGWTLAGGIIDILFAILLIMLPPETAMIVFVYFIGFWILFRSIWTIGMASDLGKYTNSGWLILIGVLGLLFSICFLLSPTFGGIMIVALVSVAMIFYGVFRIYYSLQIRKLNKRVNEELKK